jgi:hypothetical protein
MHVVIYEAEIVLFNINVNRQWQLNAINCFFGQKSNDLV